MGYYKSLIHEKTRSIVLDLLGRHPTAGPRIYDFSADPPEKWEQVKKTYEEKVRGKPLKSQCCTACYLAKGPRCQCRCGGRYHGLGTMRPLETFSEKEDEKIDE